MALRHQRPPRTAQVVEVASSVDAEGRAVFDPEELVAAIGHALHAFHSHGASPGSSVGHGVGAGALS
jgi:hypothetical protein